VIHAATPERDATMDGAKASKSQGPANPTSERTEYPRYVPKSQLSRKSFRRAGNPPTSGSDVDTEKQERQRISRQEEGSDDDGADGQSGDSPTLGDEALGKRWILGGADELAAPPPGKGPGRGHHDEADDDLEGRRTHRKTLPARPHP